MKNQGIIHPNRHSTRLGGYDYTRAGAYFVTVVTWQRKPIFGEVINGGMQLNLAGQCAAAIWMGLEGHFHIQLGEWVVMPNHLHGIVIILDDDGTETPYPNQTGVPLNRRGEAPGELFHNPPKIGLPGASPLPPHLPARPDGTEPGSLGAIIQNYKSVTTRRINRLSDSPREPVWQRNYYDHIVRDQAELAQISLYIHSNPILWLEDQENPEVV